MKDFTYVIFFLLSLSSLSVKAVQPYLPKVANAISEPWRWKNFPELDGNGVRHIAEGEGGTIWVGADDGIFEYNGYDWELHESGKNGLSNAPINYMLITQQGKTIAVSDHQLFLYDGQTWNPLLSATKNFDFNFSKAIQLHDQTIIVSSYYGVLHLPLDLRSTPKFYTSSVRIESLKNEGLAFQWVRLPETFLNGEDFLSVSDILEEKAGTVWFAFTFGETGRLLRFELPAHEAPYITDYDSYSSSTERSFGEGQRFLQTDKGEIWIINSSSRIPIQIWKKGSWRTLRLSKKFSTDEYANDIKQTNDGTIWIGALGKLYAFHNNKWELYDAPTYKIPANKLKLYNSPNNKLWITGLRSKVYYLDHSFDRWLTYKNLNFQCDVSTEEQWFLDIEGKAISKNGNRWLAWDTTDGLMDSPVRIIVTRQGQIWAAGSHNGIAATAYLKNEKWHRKLHPKLSWGIDYRAVFEARDGSIWFGGSVDAEISKGQYGGVLQLTNPEANDFEWIHHRAYENGMEKSNAYGIGQSPDGRIWTGGSRLNYFNGKDWNAIENEQLNQYVNTLTNTDSLLIVGSRYYGIFIYDGKQWKSYNKQSGLADNTIISIDALSEKDIWVATENDICHFDGTQWQTSILPTELNMDFEGGDIKHSMNGAIWINRSDRRWKRRAYQNELKQKNYNNFETHQFRPDRLAPETDITFFTSEVSSDGNTLIQWQGKDFFDETTSEKLLFSSRLNDQPWSEFSHSTQHTFLSLSNGTYHLQVRSMDLGGNIDTSPASITFSVKPPVWKQAWFTLLVGSFLLIISIFGYNIFTKNKILENLNDNLLSANNLLKLKSKQIEDKNTEITEQQTLILDQKQSLELINNDLEKQNHEIQFQRDQLEDMIGQVEDLSKAKLSFFTNISHELRTPLSLILGPINQLLNTSTSVNTEERLNLYNIINRNATRLLRLINQILEIRRIENSSLEVNRSPVVLNEFISRTTELFKNLSKNKNIRLNYTSHISNIALMLDRDKVEKIVVNLLSNSFKHTPEDGTISISLEKVDALPLRLPTHYSNFILIQVADSGEGISQQAIEHIFDRYFTSNAIDHKAESTGIGLSYIKDLVELQGGIIQVSSELGQGSRFNVYLPIVPVEEKQEPNFISPSNLEFAERELSALLTEINDSALQNHSEEENTKDQPKLLVVEDNPDMTTFLFGLLRKNYQVTLAGNGHEALKLLTNDEFDLILSDIMMPEMDGLTLCKHVKENFSSSHIPVILLTAKSLEEHQLEGYQYGADDYISKPFNPQLLDLKIGNILKQRTAFQSKLNREFQIKPKEITLTSPDEKMLENLVELMEKNIDNSSFNVNSMCQSVNLSHMHFIRKVKKLTGKRPVDLLKSFRMKRAKDLLFQDKLPIADIAYSVGFDMPSSFSRAFKKEFGISPSQFVSRTNQTNNLN